MNRPHHKKKDQMEKELRDGDKKEKESSRTMRGEGEKHSLFLCVHDNFFAHVWSSLEI